MAPSPILFFILGVEILTVLAVPNEIALPQNYTAISYKLNLHLPTGIFTSDTTEFYGKVKICFSFVNETETLSIALHASSTISTFHKITFDGVPITDYVRQHLTEIITIPLKSKKMIVTSHELFIEYTGHINTEDPVTRNGLYRSSYLNQFGTSKNMLVTQFAPNYARSVFPCFDEPGMKAIFDVSITFPTGLNAIFNTKGESKKSKISGMTTVTFESTPRISTHSLAFIVSDFTCTAGEINPRVSFRVCSRDEVASRRNLIVEMTPILLEKYKEIISYAYSSHAIRKLDIVAIPDSNIEDSLMIMQGNTDLTNLTVATPYFHHGVTENWGLIIHGENELLYNASDNVKQRQVVTLKIARKLAQQWFGNLITVNWWSEIFVNKGLAAFFETYITDQVDNWQAEGQFVVNCIHETLVDDAFGNVAPLYSKDNRYPEEIESSFNEMSYNKGGIIMRMVQHFIGLENFRVGIQSYVHKHKFGNVEINDFWKALDDTIEKSALKLPANMSTIMENWTNLKGYPILYANFIGMGEIRISQSKFVYHADHLIDNEVKWYIPISLSFDTLPCDSVPGDYFNTTPHIWLTPKDDYISFYVPLDPRSWVILNSQQTGYYRIYYDNRLMRLLKDAFEEHGSRIPAITKAYIVDDLFNFARANLMEYETVLSFLRWLGKDVSYHTWKAASDGYGFLLRRFGYTSLIGQAIANDMLMLMNNVSEIISLPHGGNHIDSLRRQLILDWACRLDQQKCIDDMLNMFHQEKEFSARPAKDLRYVVYCNTLRHSEGYSNWKFVLDLYFMAKDDPLEQDAIRSALACSKDPWLLEKYLLSSIDETSGFRFVDVMMAFIKTENNPEGNTVAYKFLINNQKFIIEKYRSTNLLEYIFVTIGERLEWSQIEDLNGQNNSRLMGEFMNYGVKVVQSAHGIKRWVDNKFYKLACYYKLIIIRKEWWKWLLKSLVAALSLAFLTWGILMIIRLRREFLEKIDQREHRPASLANID